MSLNNPISKQLSYALSVWAAVIAILVGYLGGIRLSVVFVRSAVGFTIFFALGYVAGLIIDRVLEDNEPPPIKQKEDVNDDTGEAMEGI